MKQLLAMSAITLLQLSEVVNCTVRVENATVSSVICALHELTIKTA